MLQFLHSGIRGVPCRITVREVYPSYSCVKSTVRSVPSLITPTNNRRQRRSDDGGTIDFTHSIELNRTRSRTTYASSILLIRSLRSPTNDFNKVMSLHHPVYLYSPLRIVPTFDDIIATIIGALEDWNFSVDTSRQASARRAAATTEQQQRSDRHLLERLALWASQVLSVLY